MINSCVKMIPVILAALLGCIEPTKTSNPINDANMIEIREIADSIEPSIDGNKEIDKQTASRLLTMINDGSIFERSIKNLDKLDICDCYRLIRCAAFLNDKSKCSRDYILAVISRGTSFGHSTNTSEEKIIWFKKRIREISIISLKNFSYDISIQNTLIDVINNKWHLDEDREYGTDGILGGGEPFPNNIDYAIVALGDLGGKAKGAIGILKEIFQAGDISGHLALISLLKIGFDNNYTNSFLKEILAKRYEINLVPALCFIANRSEIPEELIMSLKCLLKEADSILAKKISYGYDLYIDATDRNNVKFPFINDIILYDRQKVRNWLETIRKRIE